MNNKTYYQAVSVIFFVLTVLHIARIFYGWEAVISGFVIPMWVSWAAVVIAGYLTIRGLQFVKKS